MEFQEGMIFGKLRIIEVLEYDCLCRCECGRIHHFKKGHLEKGFVTACTTCDPKPVQRKHGETKTRLYRIWVNMRHRCNNKNAPEFHRYGGRGIKVCTEWDEYQNFKKWAICNGYSDDLTIDRIDNDGNYCPANCQWITKSENSKKIKRTK